MSERVLVCGDRYWSDRIFMAEVLDTFHRLLGFECVIEGEARGADSMAREWAERARVPVLPFPADWQTHGKAAWPDPQRPDADRRDAHAGARVPRRHRGEQGHEGHGGEGEARERPDIRPDATSKRALARNPNDGSTQ